VEPSLGNLPIPRRLFPRIRCHAHRSNGSPCRAWAMHGLTVCAAHGGRTPAAKAAALQRLQFAAWDAYTAGWLDQERVQVQQRAADVRRLLGLDARTAKGEAAQLARMRQLERVLDDLEAALLRGAGDSA
jgi:hypothetical protein